MNVNNAFYIFIQNIQMSPLVIITLSICFSAFFSGMEIAFVTSNKLRFELEKQSGGLGSNIISLFFDNPQQFIATMLVGNNIALVIYGIQTARLLEPIILQFTQIELAVLLIQTIISTLVILVSAEFLPKTIFRINPNLSLKLFSVLLLLCYVIFYPIASLASWTSKSILSWFNIRFNKDTVQPVFGRIDINNMLEESIDSPQGELMEVNKDVKLFQNALDFSNVRLRECVVPRTEVVAVDIEASLEELKQKFIESGFSKIVIYNDNIDNIIGYIHSSEFFKNPTELRSEIRQMPIVPETMAANKLMQLFMQQKKSIAVVVDEFGGTSGIVTLEDIMEEIFGEIEDEHDTTDLMARKVSENEFVLSGRMEIDSVNEKFGLDLPESDEYETIAGLILNKHEKLPKVNEEVSIDQFQFKILNTTPTKIEMVRLTIN